MRKDVFGNYAVEKDDKGDGEEDRHEHIVDDVENGGPRLANVVRPSHKWASDSHPNSATEADGETGAIVHEVSA